VRIALASCKGGAGKTSLSACLTLALAEAGRVVAIEDHDPQKALEGWLTSLSDLPIKKSGKGYQVGEGTPEHTIGDFPPADPHALAKLVTGWDRVLIPCQPSPVDVKSAVAFVALYPSRSHLRLVWNCLDGSSLSRPETLAIYEAEIGCPVAKAKIPRRVGFRNAQHSGFRGLDETSRSAILSLALEVSL
jgi:chromosome partitioning protein